MSEIVKITMVKDEPAKCKLEPSSIAEMNDPSAIKLLMTSFHDPTEGRLLLGQKTITIFYNLSGVVIPLKDAEYVMEVDALFDQREYNIWFAKVEKSLEETIVLKNKALLRKARSLHHEQRRRRTQVEEVKDPVEIVIQEYLSGIQVRASVEDQIVWQCEGNIHLLCGVGLKSGLII